MKEFGLKWPHAVVPLKEWYKTVLRSDWRSFAEVKATFGQTDQVKVASGKTVCVFDIGGNRYRLVALISYPKGKVYILRVMTHREYDRGRQRWKDEL